MKLALMLGGTDEGRSGIGRYVRELAPRLLTLLQHEGDSLCAIGTRAEHDAYAQELTGAERMIVSTRWQSPGPNALWHLIASSGAAAAGVSAAGAGGASSLSSSWARALSAALSAT